MLEILILILEFILEVLCPLFYFFLINIEREQVYFNGCLNCFINDICWFKFSNPRMPKNLSYSSHRPQPFSWIFHQQSFQQHFYFLWKLDVRWKIDLLILNWIVYLVNISWVKGWISCYELIEESSKAIVIHWKWMPIPQ